MKPICEVHRSTCKLTLKKNPFKITTIRRDNGEKKNHVLYTNIDLLYPVATIVKRYLCCTYTQSVCRTSCIHVSILPDAVHIAHESVRSPLSYFLGKPLISVTQPPMAIFYRFLCLISPDDHENATVQLATLIT